MTPLENKLLELAKILIDLNPGSALTGSLLLSCLYIDKRRSATDIDLIFNSEMSNFKIPEDWNIKPGISSDGQSLSFIYNDIKIDVLYSNETTQILADLRIGNVEFMKEKKYIYSLQPNSSSEKHRLDLEYLGYEFPENKLTDYPF